MTGIETRVNGTRPAMLEHAVAVLADRYRAVRARTEALCEPLELEDFVVSSMPDVSPTKWHLAHTSWFFETFVLSSHDNSYRSPDPRYAFLFNSYYVQAGERHCRAQRGLATRPTVEQVLAYRSRVDEAMLQLVDQIAGDSAHPALPLIELGLQHEQQHQELLVTDIKHVFWTNPLRPVYRERTASTLRDTGTGTRWLTLAEGIYHVGHRGEDFAFDNEGPQHRVFTEPFRLAARLVTNREYLQFVEDGGYRRAGLWLSAGFAAAQERRWEAPLYWERAREGWSMFTLAGEAAVEDAVLDEPACHVSFYEADAFARWAGCRLPTEFEWEIAAQNAPAVTQDDDVRRVHLHPALAEDNRTLAQLYGDVWQWTNSAYVAYPGYVPPPGAIGEYNGKWMADQWVLRGSSCATPPSHARRTYRNFFPSDARWQFAGIRLASGVPAA